MILALTPQNPSASAKSLEALVPEGEGRLEFAPGKVAWLYSVLAAAALALLRPPSLPALVVALALTGVTLCAGHSVGLHRGIIHGSYRCSRLVRGILVYLFVHTGIGGPITWIRLHHVRDHYQNARRCPRYFRYDHSLARDYFWNLHLRFVPRDESVYAIPESDVHDPWLSFLERTWPLHVVGLGALLWVGFGSAVAIVCVPLRVAVSVLGHWYVGYVAHARGAVRYELDGSAESGRNLLVLGALSFGEGFHNNHHANPRSARMGETWYEIDLGFYLLLALERLGLVTDLLATGRATPVRRFNARLVAPRTG